MSVEMIVIVLVVGAFVGFFVGRWSAEIGRARYDARRIRDQRRNYRL